MKSKAYTVWKETVIFYLGGMFYCLTELLWRGWTHGSMFLLGGLDRRFRISILTQIVLGALIVTFFEFWTGMLVNRVMHLNVWDYSHLPFNLLGQISLPFTLLWMPLSLIAIFCENYLRHALFDEPLPQVRWVI